MQSSQFVLPFRQGALYLCTLLGGGGDWTPMRYPTFVHVVGGTEPPHKGPYICTCCWGGGGLNPHEVPYICTCCWGDWTPHKGPYICTCCWGTEPPIRDPIFVHVVGDWTPHIRDPIFVLVVGGLTIRSTKNPQWHYSSVESQYV